MIRKICPICLIQISNRKYHKDICMLKEYKQNNKTKMINTKITNTDLAPLKRNITIIESKANELVVKTDADISTASDFIFKISEFQKAVEAKKDKLVGPAKAIIKEAQDTYNPFIRACEASEATIKAKLVVYDTIKQQIALKKLEKISQKVVDGTLSLEKASEKIDNTKVANSYEGTNSSIQFRINKVIHITDETKIPRKWLIPNATAIRLACLAGEIIPGVKVVEEKIVAKGR